MLFTVDSVALVSVWCESFVGRDGQDVEFYRALVTKAGDMPLQLSVSKDDFDFLSSFDQGVLGTASIRLDAQPGRKIRACLVGFEV